MKCQFPDCGRKVRLVDQIECKCKKVFCSKHKFRTEHLCTFDFRADEALRLEKKLNDAAYSRKKLII